MKRFEFYLYSLLVLTFGALIYGRSLGYPMVFDDEVYLAGNPIFKTAENFTGILRHFTDIARMASAQGLDGDISTNFLMRPLTYLSFHFNHRFDGLNPAGYRVVNIIIHFGNSLLVWKLLCLLLRHETVFKGLPGQAQRWVPVIGGLLFVTHPMQLESVVYIVQRATSLCTLFYLAAVVFHLQANLGNSSSKRILSCVCALGAMLSKESGVTLPVIAIMLDTFVFHTPVRTALWRARFLLCLLPVVPGLLLAVSHAQTGVLQGTAVITIAHGVRDLAHAHAYALTQPEIWLQYLRLFFWPTALNIDPDVIRVTSAGDVRFWGSALVLALLVALGLLMRGRSLVRVYGESLLLGVSWFALTICPDSSIVPLPDYMAEHRTYLPYVGICLTVSIILGCALTSPALMFAASALALCGLTLTAMARSHIWSSAERLWRDVCDKSPNKPRPWINLGAAYYEARKFTEAADAFARSIEAMPTVPAFANLAAAQLALNAPEKAYDTARSGMQFMPSGYDHYLISQVAASCERLRRWKEAGLAYQELLKRFPTRIDVRLRYAGCLLEESDSQAALEVLEAGLLLHPNSPELRDAIGKVEAHRSRFKLRLGL